MSSILTNNGAMVALQTLKSINGDLSKTQSMISTGKDVASAKDNAAVWSISKVMESDVKGFKGISDSLSRGESTVAVASQASETITDLLTDVKGKIVAAQNGNADERAKLQTDINALTDQIESVVNAAQFNGVNLINGSSGDISILSSLDRGADGSVTTSTINVAEQDLSIGEYTAKAAFGALANVVSGDQDSFATTLNGDDATGFTITIADPTYAAGDKISITIGDQSISHTITEENLEAATPEDIIATALKSKIDGLGVEGLVVSYDSAAPGALTISSATPAAGPPAVAGTGVDLAITGQFTNVGAGGLGSLSAVDVTDPAGASAALGTIETLINASVDAAAAFGSAQGRIEIQNDFIGKLTDSLKSGIGALVDADMEEASARLQALQVQQQLGVQSLSIANQAPQSILSLFR